MSATIEAAVVLTTLPSRSKQQTTGQETNEGCHRKSFVAEASQYPSSLATDLAPLDSEWSDTLPFDVPPTHLRCAFGSNQWQQMFNLTWILKVPCHKNMRNGKTMRNLWRIQKIQNNESRLLLFHHVKHAMLFHCRSHQRLRTTRRLGISHVTAVVFHSVSGAPPLWGMASECPDPGGRGPCGPWRLARASETPWQRVKRPRGPLKCTNSPSCSYWPAWSSWNFRSLHNHPELRICDASGLHVHPAPQEHLSQPTWHHPLLELHIAHHPRSPGAKTLHLIGEFQTLDLLLLLEHIGTVSSLIFFHPNESKHWNASTLWCWNIHKYPKQPEPSHPPCAPKHSGFLGSEHHPSG